MAIGGLWVPRDQKAKLTKTLRQTFRSNNIHSEVKWSKTSARYLDAYKRAVDFFFEQQSLRFRVIVVDQQRVNVKKYHGGDDELGFYKFYYQMLIKWIEPRNEYLILLDFKQNKGADRYTELRKILRSAAPAWTTINDLTVIDSSVTPLAQLTDLFTGAVAACWSMEPSGPKRELAQYIATQIGIPSLKTESVGPGLAKFNIFRIRLTSN